MNTEWWSPSGDPILKSKFKYITVLKRMEKWYKCKCVCGTVKNLHRLYLQNHPNPSCGCKSRGQKAKATNLDKVLRKKHKVYLLTKERLLEILNSNCAVCGAEPNAYCMEHLDGMMAHSVVFRKDVNIGFIPTNVEARCTKCIKKAP